MMDGQGAVQVGEVSHLDDHCVFSHLLKKLPPRETSPETLDILCVLVLRKTGVQMGIVEHVNRSFNRDPS